MTYLAFDIDGTLFDCGDIIVEAFQRGISLFCQNFSGQIQMPSREKIISVLGIPHDLIFQTLFPYLKEHEQQEINNFCTDNLAEMIYQGGGKLYNGVYSTLKRFCNEDYIILAASNGKLKYIESILNSKDLMQFFTKPIVALNSGITSKSGIIKYYKNEICRDNLLIMIGDRSSDMNAAKDNKIPFIGCSFGHAGIKELEGAEWITGNFIDIYDKVKEIERTNRKNNEAAHRKHRRDRS